MKINHIIQSQQFTVPLIWELFERTNTMKRIVQRGGTSDYSRYIMATLFYAPSTRTRFSFESAMYRLGGKVISTEHAKEFSSEFKEDRIEDTIRIYGNYCDLIVLRHYEVGGAARAAQYSSVPIINAGDGSGGQHPTQALLDLYTIYDELGKLDGLKVALIGALDQGRTARSLAYLLSKFERIKLYFVAPSELQIKSDILDHLEEKNVAYELLDNAEKIIPEVDVIYQTRIDSDRLTQKDIDLSVYNITANVLRMMKKDAIIMHPLPRSVEISRDIDSDPRAAYFRQATNGLYVRMALITMLLDND